MLQLAKIITFKQEFGSDEILSWQNAKKIMLSVNREGLVGDVKVGGHLGQSDDKMIDFLDSW